MGLLKSHWCPVTPWLERGSTSAIVSSRSARSWCQWLKAQYQQTLLTLAYPLLLFFIVHQTLLISMHPLLLVFTVAMSISDVSNTCYYYASADLVSSRSPIVGLNCLETEAWVRSRFELSHRRPHQASCVHAGNDWGGGGDAVHACEQWYSGLC
jgi:hypothetical protein